MSAGGVNLCGYLTAESGVGTAARRYLRALRRLGVPTSLHDLSALQTNRARDDSVDLSGRAPAYGINLVVADIELHFTIVRYLGDDFFRDRYNVGIWAWEMPRFPTRWFDRFATYDEVWVGTSFIAAALSPVSPIPVVRVPPVLTPDARGSRERGRARLGVAADEFVFLFVFDFHSHAARKNPRAVIEAFRAAFGASDRARLVLKTVNATARPDDFAGLRRLAAGSPIEFHDAYWPAAEVRDLMEACDAYVSLHRSEGIGLTISDAMALGKPIVATGWSGNMDFMTAWNSCPVRYELTPLAENVGPYRAGEAWAEPSVDHAAAQMRRLFDGRAAAAALGDAARRDIEQGYGEDAIAALIGTRLDAIAVRRRWPDFRRDVASALAAYRRLPDRLRDAVRAAVPRGAIVAVVSKGDATLLDLDGRPGWHFPRRDDGEYVGFYPADDAAAIAHLDRVRAGGAGFLLLPRPAFWWLEHYTGLARELERLGGRVWDDEHCVIFRLAGGARQVA